MEQEDRDRQNLTIRLDRRVIRKVKIVAARRGTSISGLVAEQIERLVDEDDAYEQSRRRALALLDRGFHLGANWKIERASLHER